MLKVWGRRSAFNVQKAMWAIGEVGVAHEHVNAGGDAGGLDDPAFRAMNPHGRIPVIDDDGLIVWESNSVVRYLAAKYAAGTLWSADPAERSHQERWMDWGLATCQRDFLDLFWGWFRQPPEKQDAAYVADKVARCEANYRLLDAHLADRPYLAGDHFTVADIPAGTTLFRYLTMGMEVPAVPNLRAWYERLAARPAYQEHVMIPFADLRGKTSY
jgi:glutathione S-transferase